MKLPDDDWFDGTTRINESSAGGPLSEEDMSTWIIAVTSIPRTEPMWEKVFNSVSYSQLLQIQEYIKVLRQKN